MVMILTVEGSRALGKKKRLSLRKRRTREHVIADLSVNHVERHALLSGCTVERMVHDYGIDLLLFTYNRVGEIEEGQVFLQLKATEHLKVHSDGTSIAVRVEKPDLRHWLEKLLPVILIVYDAQSDVAYWLYVQAYFASQASFSLERVGDRASIRVPRANVVNQAAIRVFGRFRDDILAQVEGRIQHHE
jgi:hypothetical protein